MNLTRAFQINPTENVAFVGGGGKSTTIFRLGRELAADGKRVLLTTSTRIFAAQISLAPAAVSFNAENQSLADILPALKTALAQHGQVLLTGATDAASGKAFGVPPAIIDQLAQAGVFDVILNEADGSRMRPFKAPAQHEPVIPPSTTLVVPVVGLDALDKPLTAEHVHRPERVAQLSGAAAGSPITPQTIAAVLTHPAGGLKNIPPRTRIVPLLNKIELVQTDHGRLLAKLLLQSNRITTVAIGSVAQDDPIAWVQNRVAAIVLAAGEGRRFGAAKQLARWQGKPLLAHVVDTALASLATPVIVVLGAFANECRAALAGKPVHLIENSNWADGQSTSMQAGLATLPKDTSAAIFLLADQPLISTEIVDAVVQHYWQTLAPVVWPEFEGRRGNPVLFDRRLFIEMQQIRGDVGARPVLLAHLSEAAALPVATPTILRDVDTPGDLERLESSAKIN